MRRSGKTTRLIDKSIQYLFEKGQLYLFKKHAIRKTHSEIPDEEIVFIDPDHRSDNLAQNDFVKRVLKRIDSEHSGSVNIKSNQDYIHIKIK